MSSNSLCRILQTAPIVSALRGLLAESRGRAPRSAASERARCWETATGLLLQEAQLVLADLDLVPIGEAVRLDPPPVHVGAVQRAEVVDVEPVAPPNQQCVIARHRHVVEEDAGVGAAPDADPVLGDREALPRPTAAGPDHERRARLFDDLIDVDRLHLAGLVDRVGHRGRLVASLRAAQVGAALLAVVSPFRVGKAALWAVDSHCLNGPALGSRLVFRRWGLFDVGDLVLGGPARLAGEDLRQLANVVAGDQRVAALTLVTQAVDELGSQDVDLAVQDPAPV